MPDSASSIEVPAGRDGVVTGAASILRVGWRPSHDLGIHRKLPVIAPFDFIVLSELLDQADAATASQEQALREPEFRTHLGLFENHSRTGIEARQEQAPRYGIGGLGLHRSEEHTSELQSPRHL